MAKSQSFSPAEAGFESGQASTQTGVFVCIHGHFYQPPRENPYLAAVERQPSAAPFHDWNERILHECYRPNAFARILDERGEVVQIVNNFDYISFNIGPTLMSWLERHDLETYQRILAADRRSCDRHNGHGNAIAQVYNHIILPLANQRDKLTQVRWGKADFQKRFGRDPEGMWLAETAVDVETLSVLIDQGIRFIILAPSQAERCREMGQADWQTVGDGNIDPTRPYRCYVPGKPDGQNAIDIFFYDGPISGDIGFDDVLSSSQQFAGRVGQAVRDEPHRAQLISVATDGETFGHHRGGAEKALAYALVHEFAQRGWRVISYAQYLSLCPPTWEVELKPVTAWSCSHGVDRWQDSCGCGGGGGWQQDWRRPLRQTLDWLRDRLAELYLEFGAELLRDPWQARDAYVQVIGDRSPRNVNRFLNEHQHHKLNPAERVDALRLLEMQRYTLLMYTSCGWFFDELSRPEGTQILRYASRAIELAEEVSGQALEAEFVRRIALAPSNVAHFKDGAGVYRELVTPARVSPEQVVAHYAMTSLFDTYRREQRLYCYTIHQKDYQLQPMGSLTLAMGQVQLVSEVTQDRTTLAFAVLHLGGWDFHCGIQSIKSRAAYGRTKSQVMDAFSSASVAQTILAINRCFGERSYTLQNLFPEERHRIMRLLSQETLQRLNQLYNQVYRDNYGVLMAFHRDRLAVPQELQVAADIALSHRALSVVQSLEQDISDPQGNVLNIAIGYVGELEGIAIEASHFRSQLKLPGVQQTVEQLISRILWQALKDFEINSIAATVEGLSRLIQLGQNLGLGLSLARAQELYYEYISSPTGMTATLAQDWSEEQQKLAFIQLLKLGELLAVNASSQLSYLATQS